jgi:hypothetical protein
MRNIAPKHTEFDDLIAGWEYNATFQRRTPLAYLEKHGEFSPGPKEPPLFGPEESFLEDGRGFNPYGIWLRVIDWEGQGFIPPAEGTRSSEWGLIRVGSTEERDLLSFLKSFRYIVETAETLDQKLSELAELSVSTPENRRVWKMMGPDFPDSFFIGELTCNGRMYGIGEKKADRLYRAGFRTVEEIQSASDENLLKVQGVGKSIIKKIRENL